MKTSLKPGKPGYRPKSQMDAALHVMKSGRKLTAMMAFSMMGATRLSRIIFDLKKRGHKIKREMAQTKTRYGFKCQYAVYSMKAV